MKTFEERYTAWLDGQLDGPALTAFELELSRRAAAGEAQTDRRGAEQLHSLLAAHLQAPAMTNGDFFNHQLRERIEADQRSEQRRATPSERRPLFAWSFARLAGLGAAFLFAASALYYGLIPHPGSRSDLADSGSSTKPSVVLANNSPAPAVTSPDLPTRAGTRDPSQRIDLAKLDPLPSAIEEVVPDIEKVQVSEQAGKTTATPLHYQQQDVNVLWINGLDYIPDVPGDSPATQPSPGAQP